MIAGRLERSPSIRHYSWLWPMLLLALMSFCIHLLPLAFSAYPFNNDSLVEGSMARDIVDTGRMRLPGSDDVTTTHSESTPGWNLVLAFVGASLGMDPMFASQYVVAAISVLAPLVVYVLLLMLGANRGSAMAGGFFIALFGTFLFMSASGWKLALGVQLYVLFVFFYARRSDRKMRILMSLVLIMLPLVHHLAAIVGYMTFAFLTGWSLFFAIAYNRPRRMQYHDLITLGLFALLAFGYYYSVSFDRLSYVGSAEGFLILVAVMVVLMILAVFLLMRQSHYKWTFAPLPALAILSLSLLDYNGYLFNYTPSQGAVEFYLLTAATSILAYVGWYGLEIALESNSRYRAIPLGMFLPAVTVIGFALVSPTVEDKHQLIYRSFDFIDPAVALGVGMAFFGILRRDKLRRFFPVLLALFLVVLLSTVPYGIYTEKFTGVRHDTQAYEIDAFDWVTRSHYNATPYVSSDERISYIAWTLYGLGKDNTLPERLLANETLIPGIYNFYESFWSEKGVNGFPDGLIKVDSVFMGRLMAVENVFYVGGPEGDQLMVIQHSWIGQIYNNWYYEP